MRDSGRAGATASLIADKLALRLHRRGLLARSVRDQAEPVSRRPAPGPTLELASYWA